MFANTLDFTIGSTTYTLKRVNQDSFGSEYKYSSATEALNLKIRHSDEPVGKDGIKMKRHNVFMEYIQYPTPTTLIKKYTSTCTFRQDQFGSPAVAADLTLGLNAWISTSGVAAGLASGEN